MNDMGDWTRAAPDLYPHQWSWDSAFIAIGLVHLDTRRAAKELLALLSHQWKTGKIPHIVFNPEAPLESYFPGPEHWACAAASPDAPPAPPYTSCLCQPPVKRAGIPNSDCASIVTCGPENRCGFAPWPDLPP